MNKNSPIKDKTLCKIYQLIEKCENMSEIEIISIVLFGPKAQKISSSQSKYKILILIDEDSKPLNSAKFYEYLKIYLLSEKLYNVTCSVYTPNIFENILYNDDIIGSFFYIILKENIVLYDKMNIFYKIRERMISEAVKPEENFIKQCIRFSELMDSEKWKDRWEKRLMQHKYLKNKN